MQTHVTSNFQM